jgi:hypothetical protein
MLSYATAIVLSVVLTNIPRNFLTLTNLGQEFTIANEGIVSFRLLSLLSKKTLLVTIFFVTSSVWIALRYIFAKK